MTDDLMRQAEELVQARLAERESAEREAAQKAADRAQSLLLLAPDIDRQLTELSKFATDFLGQRGIPQARLYEMKKHHGTSRDPVSYEYHYSSGWRVGEFRTEAWTLHGLGAGVSADGSWWVQSENRQQETKTWTRSTVADLVRFLSEHGGCILGHYRVQVLDEGNGQALLMASSSAGSPDYDGEQEEQKLQHVVVKEVTRIAEWYQRHT